MYIVTVSCCWLPWARQLYTTLAEAETAAGDLRSMGHWPEIRHGDEVLYSYSRD